ncbi:hypothetical protein As57867_003503, partial [Aphanomyces stellatus]
MPATASTKPTPLRRLAQSVHHWFKPKDFGSPRDDMNNNDAFPAPAPRHLASKRSSMAASPRPASIAPLPQVRLIRSISTAHAVIHCTRVDIASIDAAVVALSHPARESPTDHHGRGFTVLCDREPPYICWLSDMEATQLAASYLLHDHGGLWLDFICIDGSRDADVAAQQSIRGALFLVATTYVVGADLRPVLPPPSYFDDPARTQERHFGRVR